MSETARSTRRLSDRTKKKSIPENFASKKTIGCSKTGCGFDNPVCCLQACDTCWQLSGHTARWYHLSLGEHYCNNCFDHFYRIGKNGHEQYSSWNNQWLHVARASKPNFKKFAANELSPYWVKCVKCSKWRSIRHKGTLSSDMIEKFVCTTKEPNGMLPCEVAEDEAVAPSKEASWMMQLAEEPLVKRSPAGPYLKRFLAEDVGLYPTDCWEHVFPKLENIDPFYVGQCGESPIWIKPDELDADEIELAKNVLVFPMTYLGLRNLIVAVWNMFPKHWLTVETVQKYLILRGLVRIYLVIISEHIINLLTKKGVINYGIVECDPDKRLFQNRREKIVVVGGGIAGLAAARHLVNLGVAVVVLEAKSVPLGRMHQDSTVVSDAIFIQGLTNNPFTILARQANKAIQTLDDSFIVFNHTGEQIPFTITERIDYELYGLIHGAIEWATLYQEDSNWYDTIMKNFKEISKMSVLFKHPDIFHLFFNQFEIEQRADLRNLSLLNTEFITPLIGNDGIIPDGMNSLANQLVENVPITYNSEVKSIDYTANEVIVMTANDNKIVASHVLLTVPVSVLRDNKIQFNPALPDFKYKAATESGDYFCEKLIMEFPKKFWTRKIKDTFGKFHIVSPEELFFLFVDVTVERKNSPPTLMTYIPQRSVEAMKDLDDEMIVEKCMTLLKNVFYKDGSIPEPSKWLLTHWSENIFGGSYGTYVKVDGSQNCYDDLAKTVDDKIFFAGEATFRNIPSTISGAFLSGLREAANIVKRIENSENCITETVST